MNDERVSYKVPVENLRELDNRLALINRKAKRLGCEPVSYTVSGHVTEERTNQAKLNEMIAEDPYHGARFTSDMIPKIKVVFAIVEVEGVPVVLAGWQFMATIQHVAEVGANIVRCVPGFEAPVAYRDAKSYCDHCHTLRQRRDTYLVRHSEAGEIKQVGSSCLKDFLGGHDPKHAASMCEWMGDIEACFRDSEEWGGQGCGIRYTDLHEFLSWVASCIRQFGWVSKGEAKASYDQKRATADEASGNMDAYRSTYVKPWDKPEPPTDADQQVATAAIEWGRKMRDLPEPSDYEYNLGVACSPDYVLPRCDGIVASAVAGYLREQEKLRRQSMPRVNEWAGAVGDKLKGLKVTVVSNRGYESEWGEGSCLKLVTDEGVSLVWWTKAMDVQPGEQFILKGRIKKLGEYQGMKETTMTRCTLDPAVEAAA